jgi:hypothetical protein
MAKIARTACEACGSLLGGAWFARHAGKGTQKLCADCARDALGRLDTEADLEFALLEHLWQLPANRVELPTKGQPNSRNAHVAP